MLELVKAGGWLMLPIIVCSVVALAIIVERVWSLKMGRVLPKHLVAQVWRWEKVHKLNGENLRELQASSPLGSILAAGILNRYQSRDVMKESIEDTGRHIVHELERYLNTLGTVAAITPLLGLLGTVIGMIKVFATITTQGVGDPGALAGGMVATGSMSRGTFGIGQPAGSPYWLGRMDDGRCISGTHERRLRQPRRDDNERTS